MTPFTGVIRPGLARVEISLQEGPVAGRLTPGP